MSVRAAGCCGFVAEFDASIFEIAMALAAGGTLAYPRRTCCQDRS